MYKDKLVGPVFIDRCLQIFAVFNRFKAGYGNKRLDFYTKREMNQYDFFPKPLPDAYITIKNKGEDDSRYFLEIYDVLSPFFTHRRTLNKHMEYYDSGEWEEEVGGDYPNLLLICETPQLERRIQKLAERLQASTGAYMTIYTTSTKVLLAARSPEKEIWTDIDELEELVALSP